MNEHFGMVLFRRQDDKRFLLGIFFTLLWCGVVAVLGGYRFHDIAELDLYGWSGIVSGFTAPMAFLWLVLGYRQQGQELKTNTKALRAQGEEQQRYVKIAAYTALMQHYEQEMKLFDSLGADYKKASLNSRSHAKNYAEKIKQLIDTSVNKRDSSG